MMQRMQATVVRYERFEANALAEIDEHVEQLVHCEDGGNYYRSAHDFEAIGATVEISVPE